MTSVKFSVGRSEDKCSTNWQDVARAQWGLAPLVAGYLIAFVLEVTKSLSYLPSEATQVQFPGYPTTDY
jgi:hypothetical protein